MLARDQSSTPAADSSSRTRRCSPSHTPASCHSLSRRQAVCPEPHPSCGGRSRQRQPVIRTNMIPSRANRSGIRGRPPGARPTGGGGISGSSSAQSRSSTSRRGGEETRVDMTRNDQPRSPLPARATRLKVPRPGLSTPQPSVFVGRCPQRAGPPAATQLRSTAPGSAARTRQRHPQKDDDVTLGYRPLAPLAKGRTPGHRQRKDSAKLAAATSIFQTRRRVRRLSWRRRAGRVTYRRRHSITGQGCVATDDVMAEEANVRRTRRTASTHGRTVRIDRAVSQIGGVRHAGVDACCAGCW